jgi:hypothetical protein
MIVYNSNYDADYEGFAVAASQNIKAGDRVSIVASSDVGTGAGYVVPSQDAVGEIVLGSAKNDVKTDSSRFLADGETLGHVLIQRRGISSSYSLVTDGSEDVYLGATVYSHDATSVATAAHATNDIVSGTIEYFCTADGAKLEKIVKVTGNGSFVAIRNLG